MFLPQRIANKAMILMEKTRIHLLQMKGVLPKIPNRLESQLKRSVVVVFN